MAFSTPELLAPAGSRLALEAAIEGGADAVYFGAPSFNARLRAKNFTDEDMTAALSLCRAHGVKSYITVNTRLFDDELSDALKLAAHMYNKGATALIVADMGLARLIKQHIPQLEIHASTQLSGHSVADARRLCEAGFSRMVCHREADANALEYLCKNSPVEIEMFIHGAYCVSFSGQCLMSAVMGGRSGNRGECAQPCRQPYYQCGAKGYPISLKDMCLASHIPEICKSGVASLKIEGRQKPPEYVFGVTRIYRRLLDEGRAATDGEIEALRKIFSRDGFTDGYYRADGRKMRGVRTYGDYLEMDKSKFGGIEKKVPLDAELYVRSGERGRLRIKTPFGKGEAFTENVLCDEVAPLDPDGARRGMARLGSTPYKLDNFKFDADSAAPLTLSALNKLRRDAVAELERADREKAEVPLVSFSGNKPRCGEIYTAEFSDVSQIPNSARDFFSRIYVPMGTQGAEEYGISLPPYMPDGAIDGVMKSISPNMQLLCHSAAQLDLARSIGAEAAGSLRLNVFNSEAAEYYGSLSSFITASPEVRLAKLRHMASPCPMAAVVYGRLPLMLTVRCAISDGGKNCAKGCGMALPSRSENGKGICRSEIADRHHVAFPVLGMPDCTNVIYNSVPIYMADRLAEVRSAGISVMHFIFTTETKEEAEKIITAYKRGFSPPEKTGIRRMQ